MKLRIYSSSRKIKQYYEKSKQKNGLLDFAINISDFLDNVCLMEKNKASHYQTLILMQKACLKTANLKEKLGISTEFFAFLKNNEYLFSFFKELSLSKKSILDLQNNDYYTAYNEHLQILDEVFKNYLYFLEQENLYDDISLIYEYKLNFDYLDLYDEFIYDLQGFLSKFEQDLLEQISKYKKTTICFKTSIFNIKYLKEFSFLSDLDIKENKYYEINISDKIISKEQDFIKKTQDINIKSFEIRSLQASYVYDNVSKFIKEDLDPQNIIIITPDEEFCDILRFYDKKNMLNYASGISIKESAFYQKLRALYISANLKDFHQNKNQDYFDNENTKFDFHNVLLNIFELDLDEFKVRFFDKSDENYFEKLIDKLLENETKELKQAIKKELFFIKEFHNELSLKEILELFFIQIKTIKTSYVGGGAITTMGLLESRGLEFDGVIVVDFNDEFIPKRNVNELFLNNDIRKKAGLISHEKRENLQRFYYESLFKNAKKISISYVENEQSLKSRFLDELDFNFLEQNQFSNKAYLDALNINHKGVKIDLTPIKAPILKYDIFEKTLYFSRLNLFLNHKRTYYYKYILNLPSPRELCEQNKARNLGIFIHNFLEDFYSNHSKNGFDEKKFFILLDEKTKNISKLDAEILKLKFKEFAKKEKERFRLGYVVKNCEFSTSKKISINNKDITLIGQIDRIDTLNGNNLIIDYKSSKIEDNSYQLAFYKLLYDESAEAKFYDLNDFSLKEGVKTKSLDELKELLKELCKNDEEIEFENKDQKNTYCPYKLIYAKDLK